MSAANLVGSATSGATGGSGRPNLLSDRYQLLEALAAGAEGRTHLALDVASGRQCVVKVFAASERFGSAAHVGAQFRRLQQLEHAGIVKALDIGRTRDGELFLVTEYVPGASPTAIARVADVDERRRAFERLAIGLADALAYLHGRGLVHGDVCSGNIRVTAEGRPVLIDFGLAGRPSRASDGAARGTFGYAAPEALVGVTGPAGDLFGLGAALYEAWTGAPPFGLGLDAVRKMLAGRAPTISVVRPGLAPFWDDVIARLLAARAEDRLASARELMGEISRGLATSDTAPEIDMVLPSPAGDPLAGITVARQAEREALATALEQLAEGAAPIAAIALVGAPGAGRRTLIELAVRDARIAQAAGLMAPIEVLRGPIHDLERALGLPEPNLAQPEGGEPVPSDASRFARLVDALEARARTRPACVVLDEGPPETALARFISGADPSGRVLVVVATGAPLERRFARDLTLAPLDPDAISEMARRGAGAPPPPGVVARIAQVTGGHAAAVAILVRRLVEAMRAGEGERFRVDADADLRILTASTFAALPSQAQRLVAAIALGLPAPARAASLSEGDATASALVASRAGWLIAQEPSAYGALPGALHQEVALAALAAPAFHDLARIARAELPPDALARAEALAALGERDEAARVFRNAGRGAAANADVAGQVRWLERAAALGPGVLELQDRLALLAGLAALGRYDDAGIACDEAAAFASTPVERATLAERRAWLLGRRGDLASAREVLVRAIEQLTAGAVEELGAPSASVAAPLAALRGRLARLLVTMGRFEEALAAARPSLDSAGDGPPQALEAVALASAYTGRAEAARGALAALARKPGGISKGRIAYLGALVDHLDGSFATAIEHYRQALEVSSAEGDVHVVGAGALNLGALLAEQGLYAEALEATGRATRELGRLGATAELGTAFINAANLFVQIGRTPAARRALGRARDEGSRRGGDRVDALATYVEADLARREGQVGAAARLYKTAAGQLVAAGQGPAAWTALLAEAEALAEAGRVPEAQAALGAAVARRGELVGPDEQSFARELAVARARVLLCAGNDATAPVDLSASLRRAAETEAAIGRRPVAWRAAALAARLYHRQGDAIAARDCSRLSRRLFEEIRMATPPSDRSTLDADPDARWLGALAGDAGPEPADAARAARAESRLRRLLRINKRLNSELRLPRLLDMVIDTVIELTDAERGFLLLEEGGELVVKVARNIDQRTLETAEFELSRSIARKAAAGGEPIVTIDATGDDRFREALSVSDLHLRSVLAVPLQIKGKAVGTIYVDHRLRRGAFDQEDVSLVLDFAEQAAIALENARLMAELRRRERQVETLNRRLEVELAARREELTSMKQELRESRDALAVRYDYRNIVGRTPRMLELFRLLDRITDTTLPVLIQGESGTGKELVARALHFNGPRRDRPFVSENCAAIPETLLESTLFGFVRGAFTGADHDTRGLFEVADGGTLFLDEVGEMSPGMQGKLLRVLQTGEFRRVGSERTRKVEVRVVAATNRDLSRMVDEGKFRQDLFYRLAVARISLPALRDRREDIPLIVEHLLAKNASAVSVPPKTVEPAALARLMSYRWPGNVRELENELMRAAALSGERITLADLSPQVLTGGEGGPASADDPDSLAIRPRVERMERALLREALIRSGNNQTKAAELLGLSRFGLQKKLHRYGFI